MTLTSRTLMGIFILPAVVFAVVYFPIVTQLSRGLLSPYVKADVRKRLFAASVDGLMVVTTGRPSSLSGSVRRNRHKW